MITSYFFDTYSFIESHKANSRYEKFKGKAIITTKMNLMEFHYTLLREVGKNLADIHLRYLQKFIVEFEIEHIKLANQLRRKYKNLSYVDCLGYIVALANQVPFVTGDQAFKNLPNVEFIK
tara:strand:- start:12439 stop:12801 length:363 start_codon:yes stop_codon:yes gene_type:complete